MEFLIVLGSLIFSLFVGGWGFSVCWNWFVSPVFGITVLSIPQAIGLHVLITLAKGFSLSEKNLSTGEIVYNTFKHAFMVLFTVGIGYVIRIIFM